MTSDYLPSLGRIVVVLIAGWCTLLLTLATLWAANPRATWLNRFAPIGLLLAVLIPMGLFAFASMFAIQAAVVVALLAAVPTMHGWRAHRVRVDTHSPTIRATSRPLQRLPQFSLGQLFASLLLGAAILALVLSAPDEEDIVDFSASATWLHLGLLGLTLATPVLLAWMLVVAGRWRTVGCSVVALFLVAFSGQQSGLAESLAAQFEITDRWLLAAVWIVSLSLVLSCCLWLLAQVGWNWWPLPAVTTRRPSKLARVVIGLVCVVLTLPTLDLAWALVPPARPVESALPSPNGYAELLEIERNLTWDAVAQNDGDEATSQQIAKFVADNKLQIAALTAALELPSHVPIDWRPGYQPLLSGLLNLFVALDYHAKAALDSGLTEHATNDYLNALRLSNTCANGGTGAEELIANTIDMLASGRLASLLNELNDMQLRKMQRTTAQCLVAREPIEPIIDRTKRHERITGGWSGRLSAWLVKHRLSKGWDAAVELPNHRAARDARLNLLIVECALQRYHLQHGSYPERLSQLTPEFLAIIPQDPFADEPFRYRRTDAGYLLYSINADRVDNGGIQPEYRGLYEGDLMLRP